MLIDLLEFYDVGRVEWWKSCHDENLFDIELISQSTGEIITWTFDEPHFDKFLKQLEANIIAKQRLLEELKYGC